MDIFWSCFAPQNLRTKELRRIYTRDTIPDLQSIDFLSAFVRFFVSVIKYAFFRHHFHTSITALTRAHVTEISSLALITKIF